ncbi:IPT/TIG domain-containing protein [Pontibacter harenae]|uniref:IPT/TIG domain-containing protein n=1 Tax=Pontibacter harenae TaxID=2894083 RepID=UPI003F7085AF
MPAGAETGRITVTNPQGSGQSEVFTVIGPTITSVSPSEGYIGDEVVISGENLEDTERVTFNGLDADFGAVTDENGNTVIYAVVPEGAETGPLEVTTSGGGTASVNFVVLERVPTNLTINPTSGEVGDLVTIYGENLGDVTEVVFGGGAAVATENIVIVPDGESFYVQVAVPAGAETGSITVTNPQGSGQSEVFTVIGPTITSVTPDPARLNQEITITGARLSTNGTAPTVTFNSIEGGEVRLVGEVFSFNETSVVVIVPTNAASGTLTLTTAEGPADYDNFEVLRPDVVLNTNNFTGEFTAAVGNTSNVQSYVVSGTNFAVGEESLAITAPEHFQIATGPNGEWGASLELPLTNLESGMLEPTTIYVRYLPTEATEEAPHTGSIDHITVGESEALVVNGTATAVDIDVVSPNPARLLEQITITGTRLRYNNENPIVTFNNVIVGDARAIGDIVSSTETSVTVIVPTNAASGTIELTTFEGTAEYENFQVLRPDLVLNAELTVFTSTLNQPSAVQTYTVTGSNLAVGETEVVVTAPENFQIALDAAGPFEYQLNIPLSNATTGTLNETPIYIRYLPTTEGTHNEFISHNTEAENELLAVTGTTGVEPTITLTPTTLYFKAAPGDTSATQTYSVSGIYLNGDINISLEDLGVGVAHRFEISEDNVSFITAPITLEVNTDGEVSPTKIYVRYVPGAEASTSDIHNERLVHSSINAETRYLALEGTANDLPVELVSFTAQQQSSGTVLKWKTASEKDNDRFEIEMAYNPMEGFSKIGEVKSKVGTSSTATNYTYTHFYNGEASTRYYRLKQIDTDGVTFAYSSVVAVEAVAEAVQVLTVAPNPINYSSKVYIMANSDGKAILRVSNIAGKQVYFKDVEVTAGENEVSLPLYDKLPNGVYILTVEVDGKLHQTKVLKR